MHSPMVLLHLRRAFELSQRGEKRVDDCFKCNKSAHAVAVIVVAQSLLLLLLLLLLLMSLESR